MGNQQQGKAQPQQQQNLQQTTQQIQQKTQALQEERPDIETEFLDLVLPNRRQCWEACLRTFNVTNMDGLIAAYGLDRQSRVGRRCNEAEHLILNNYFLKKQKEEWICFEEKQVVLEPLMTVFKSAQLSQLNLVKQDLILRNILIVGITGSGKTTFINSFISYLKGIDTKTSYRKNERFNVIQSNNGFDNDVISYQIEHEGYLLNFIDTPGLGDTKGFEEDQIIITKITKYLEEDLHACGLKLHAVLIVSQQSTSYGYTQGHRSLQQMAMLNILKLFGKNMCEFSKHIITFSDFTSVNRQNFESERSIFYSLSLQQKELQIDVAKQYYQFQNSLLKAEKIGFIEQIQFQKNISSFAALLKVIHSSEGFQLDQTKIVIKERINILKELDEINLNMKFLITLKRILQSNANKISIFQKKIEESKDYCKAMYITRCINQKAQKGEYFTNCLNCNKTCHEKCKAENTKLYQCTAMVKSYASDGKVQHHCNACKCSFEQHRNQEERWLFQTEAIVKIIEDLKEENDYATMQIQNLEFEKQFQVEELRQIGEKIKQILKQMKSCLENLYSSALYKLDIDSVDVLQYFQKCFPEYRGFIREYQEELPDLTIKFTQSKLSHL